MTPPEARLSTRPDETLNIKKEDPIMGLYMELMWPFMAWMLGLCIIGCIVIKLINKFFMYHAPEDEEVWEPGKKYFTISEADQRSE